MTDATTHVSRNINIYTQLAVETEKKKLQIQTEEATDVRHSIRQRRFANNTKC